MATWEFNGLVYGTLKLWIGDDGTIARWIGYGATVVIAVGIWTRIRWSSEARFAASVGVYYLLCPTVYPWYMLMLIVPWMFVGGVAPLMLPSARVTVTRLAS